MLVMEVMMGAAIPTAAVETDEQRGLGGGLGALHQGSYVKDACIL